MMCAVWRVRDQRPRHDHADPQVHLLDLLGEEIGLVAADVHHRHVVVAAAAHALEVGLGDAVADEVKSERLVGVGCIEGEDSIAAVESPVPCASSASSVSSTRSANTAWTSFMRGPGSGLIRFLFAVFFFWRDTSAPRGERLRRALESLGPSS
jgi:hypothetical protein